MKKKKKKICGTINAILCHEGLAKTRIPVCSWKNDIQNLNGIANNFFTIDEIKIDAIPSLCFANIVTDIMECRRNDRIYDLWINTLYLLFISVAFGDSVLDSLS